MEPSQHWSGTPHLWLRKSVSSKCVLHSWSWRGMVHHFYFFIKERSWNLADTNCLSRLSTSYLFCAHISAKLEINAFLRKMDRDGNSFGFLGDFFRSTMESHSCSGASRVQARHAGLWAWLAFLSCSCITRAWATLGSHVRLWVILWLPIISCISGWRTEVWRIRKYLIQ